MQVCRKIEDYSGYTSIALGLFDGLHLAHASVIQNAVQAAKEFGFTAAVLTFRPDATEIGSKPNFRAILSEEQKLERIASFAVQYVWEPPFTEIADLSADAFFWDILVGKLHTKVLSCGYDYTFGKGASGDVTLLAELCGQAGIMLRVQPPLLHGSIPISSTRIRELIALGDIAGANELLGYPYYILGEIVHGRALGRTLGFPTLNQQLSEMQVLPKFGVYTSTTTLNGIAYAGITNIGIKPTIEGERLPLAETYLLDMDGDFYGMTARVVLHSLTRQEQRFENLEELKRAVQSDIAKRRIDISHD